MKAGKKKRRALRQTVLKAVSYTALLIAGQLLSVLGGYCCIMRHLSDAVGIPLMTAGFFLIVVFAHRMQEEYDRFISSKYSGRPLYRIKRKREKRAKVFVDLDGVLAKWNTDASVEDTFAPGFFLTREPEPEAIAAVMLMRKAGLDVYILSCAYCPAHIRTDWRRPKRTLGWPGSACQISRGSLSHMERENPIMWMKRM